MENEWEERKMITMMKGGRWSVRKRGQRRRKNERKYIGGKRERKNSGPRDKK